MGTRYRAKRRKRSRLDLRDALRGPAAWALSLALGLVALLGPSIGHAQAEPARRIALVIGNATYTNGGVLDNPENDADAVAAKLSSLGFQVTARKNLGQTGMRNLFGAFMSTVRDGDLVVVYYAGHGIEADGRDYMLPVDVALETPSAVQFQGIPLDMAYPDKATFGVIIIFDACRDNPFLRKVKGAVAGTHALSPPVGSLVLFSASSGDVAEDSGAGTDGAAHKNSVFTTALVNALSVPGASIQKIYQLTLREVRTQTTNRQAPQRFGDLADDFVFNRAAGTLLASTPPAPAPAASEPPRPVAVAQAAPEPGPDPTSRPAPTSFRSAPVGPAVTPPPPATATATATEGVAAAAEPPKVLALNTTTSPTRPDAAPAPVIASSPPPASPPRPPAAGDSFTIAALGMNILPPPPVLQPVPAVNIPAKFCSIEEQIAFLTNVFRPAYDAAYRNNEAAIAYLSGLNRLGAEYNGRQSGFVFQIKSQFEAFAATADAANRTSNETLALDGRIRAVPVAACSSAGR